VAGGSAATSTFFLAGATAFLAGAALTGADLGAEALMALAEAGLAAGTDLAGFFMIGFLFQVKGRAVVFPLLPVPPNSKLGANIALGLNRLGRRRGQKPAGPRFYANQATSEITIWSVVLTGIFWCVFHGCFRPN
jgi:hypothetical protein